MKSGLNKFLSSFRGKGVTLLLISSIFTGCSFHNLNNNQEKVKIDEHSSKMALDWNGLYKGMLPCASCPGILTTIKLNNDETFEKTDVYLETKIGKFTEKGKFTFSKDGNKVILKYSDGSKNVYALGENRLIMLDKDGKIGGSDYELRKVLK